jgi:hypothetical protein
MIFLTGIPLAGLMTDILTEIQSLARFNASYVWINGITVGQSWNTRLRSTLPYVDIFTGTGIADSAERRIGGYCSNFILINC